MSTTTTVTTGAVTPAVAAASITPVQSTVVMPNTSSIGTTETVATAGGAVEVVKTEVSADVSKARAFATGEKSYNVPGLVIIVLKC
jgi:hypothetical protein